jgi:hypothetical protein
MAIEILPLVGGFIMGTFAIAFHMSVTSGHFAGLFITLAGCVMFGTTMVLLIRKTFSLIHVIPDQILTWMGMARVSSAQRSVRWTGPRTTRSRRRSRTRTKWQVPRAADWARRWATIRAAAKAEP